MTKGLATAMVIAASAAIVVRDHTAAVSAAAPAAAKMSTRAAHAPPSKAKNPSWGALRAGRLPPPSADGVSPGLFRSTISRQRNSPGSAKGQHTAATRIIPHSPRRMRLGVCGIMGVTVAAHVLVGGENEQGNADGLAQPANGHKPPDGVDYRADLSEALRTGIL